MEKISPPSNNNGTLNTNQSSLSAQLPLNAFAELKSSLLPLPESGRTYSPQGPIDFNQGVSPKDINQYTTSLALASSRSTPVPTHVERLCQDRPPVLQPALMPIPTEENCGERLTTALAPSENHQEHQVLSTGEEPYIPPSAIATTMLDQQWTLPASTTVKERPSDEDSFTTSHLNPGTPLEPSRTRGDAPHQLTMDSARRTSPPRGVNPEQRNPAHSDPSADANRANGYVNPGSPRNESNPYHQRTGPQHDQSCATSDPRDHLPGWYPLGDPRTLNSAAKSTAYFTPGVPKPTRRNQTGYGSTSSHQPPYVNQQPYYQNPPPNGHYPQQRGPNRAPGRRRPDATMRMVHMGESFTRVERVLGRMNRVQRYTQQQRNHPYQPSQNHRQ
ncbi:hypothetical protein Pst134EB_014291 [Puccinia striiformis f. sp. tritici]|nr:hypothetical protein Pst134EB_014291 [Puccinia striiformis f. sp. tritici]